VGVARAFHPVVDFPPTLCRLLIAAQSVAGEGGVDDIDRACFNALDRPRPDPAGLRICDCDTRESGCAAKKCSQKLEGEGHGWRAYRCDLPDDDEPDDQTIAFYCPTCAIEVFGAETKGAV
jgi:hypothetical protein